MACVRVPSQYLTGKRPYEIPKIVATTTRIPVTSYITTVNTSSNEQYTLPTEYSDINETSATNIYIKSNTTSTTTQLVNTTSFESTTQETATSILSTIQLYSTLIDKVIETTAQYLDKRINNDTTSSATKPTNDVTSASYETTNTTTVSLLDKINSAKVINEFAPNEQTNLSTDIQTISMASMTTEFPCENCTITTESTNYGMINQLLSLIVYIKENQDKIIIAALTGVCVALFLTVIAILLPFPRKKRKEKIIVHRHSSECSRESVNQYRLSQYRTSEDEHENMSLLSAQLQTHTSQNHVAPNHTGMITSDHENDGRNSVLNNVLAKVCCTCCCYNAPWQRTGTLKRKMRDRKRDIYKIRQRYSSSMSDDNFTGRYQQRTENLVEETDGISSQAVLDNVDGRHIPVVTEQQAAIHYVPPDRRTPSFSSHASYAVHSIENPRQSPMTTSPRSARHESAYKTNSVGRDSAYRTGGFPIPHDTQNMQFNVNNILPPNHHPSTMERHSRNHTSTFKKNSPVSSNPTTTSQPVSYYPQTSGSEIYPQYTTIPSNSNHIPKDGRHRRHNTSTLPNENDFIRSEPHRHLAATARTVDLNRKDSSGRPPWMEVRRASIYDNSLPRNIEEYDFYQVPELPGGRNLNYYY